MAIILNIDTAQEAAYVSVAKDGTVVQARTNEMQKDHAAWVQPAIDQLLLEAGYKVKDLQAVGVSNGPGSYTGLRIGLSTAKGLCYALNIPLIAVGTLEVMAFAAISSLGNTESNTYQHGTQPNLLLCPMVDARRMEVFTAVYDMQLREVISPHAHVLAPSSFQELLKRQKILFLGNGSKKFQQVCEYADNAMFKFFPLNPSALATLTYRNFIGNNFAGLAYTEPLYLKEFFAMKTAEFKKP